MTLRCLLLGHKYKTTWGVQYEPGLGEAEVAHLECRRCEYKIPTGWDRPTRDDTEACGNVTTITARVGPGGGKMPIKPKCVKDKGHDGQHTNGYHTWRNIR